MHTGPLLGYEFGMSKAAKIAISLPAELLAAVDRERKETGTSRSEFFRRAVEDLFRRRLTDQEARRYVRGYLDKPEDSSQVEAALRTAVVSLAGDPWE